jgi:hypothetical protein
MKVIIETALNGWLIRTEPSFTDDTPELHVFSHSDSAVTEDEVKAFAGVLWRVNSLIGPTTGRNSKARIYVEVKPGDKHEDYKDETHDK